MFTQIIYLCTATFPRLIYLRIFRNESNKLNDVIGVLAHNDYRVMGIIVPNVYWAVMDIGKSVYSMHIQGCGPAENITTWSDPYGIW